jgi:large subunit ribosomal protein L13
MTDKFYYRHSGYPGGLKSERPIDLINRGLSNRIIYTSVKGMMPKNKLSDEQLKRLFIYRSETHPHSSQKNILEKIL